MTLDYLRDKGISVPDGISLISFDDILEATHNNLSSYNFNAPAVSAAILGYICGKSPWCEENFDPCGFVVERGSTTIRIRPEIQNS